MSTSNGQTPILPENLLLLDGNEYAYSVRIWANMGDGPWDPNKKDYIQPEELPAPLHKAYNTLWEQTGDDYLVEYKGKFYYMMDYLYNENLMREFGLDFMRDLYDVALNNAAEAANHEAMKDALVLVAKASGSTGYAHTVSVLVNAEESKEKVDKIRAVLEECMFKLPTPVLQTPEACKLKAVNIDWDTDGEDVDLPKEIEIPNHLKDEEEISDYLSDVTGFCHKGYRMVENNAKSLDSMIQSASARAAELNSANKSSAKDTERSDIQEVTK